MKRIFAGLALAAALLVAANLLILSTPYDNSDRPPERSGLVVHTDALTGCQYLSTPRGGITPRLGTECFPEGEVR